jgi:hypothetical protein
MEEKWSAGMALAAAGSFRAVITSSGSTEIRSKPPGNASGTGEVIQIRNRKGKANTQRRNPRFVDESIAGSVALARAARF